MWMAATIKMPAKKMVETARPEVWDILEEAIKRASCSTK